MAPYADTSSSIDDDDRELVALGYTPSFKREFTNLATISFAFSIMGLCSSISTTFSTPLLAGGPSSVVWCWILGACMCFTLGSSIAEIVSAYPTCGGLYTASAQLTPRKYRAKVGWLVGWLNILGQIVGLSSTEFGLSNMIWAAVVIAKDGDYEITQGKVVGLFAGLLVVHGILNSVATRWLARTTSGFVFVNLGTTILIIIVLLATTPRSEMHSADYVFGSAGIINGTGGWNDGIAFLLGLLSVQWTMTDYDATAHISEEVRRAAYAAPAGIFIAVIGTGLMGWLFNIVLVLCSGPFDGLPGASNNPVLQIMYLRMGKAGALILWVFVCFTAFFVVQTALQAASRTIFAFSRDHGLPDRGYMGRNSALGVPLPAIWFTTFWSFIPGLLDLASPIAANAIFSLTAMALDLSYIIPIFLRRVYANHPDVMFKPGPFYMGNGIVGWAANVICITWTLFIIVIFSLPTVLPVTPANMNYASVITVGVMFLSGIWYVLGGRRHYHGPQAVIHGSEPGSTSEVVHENPKDLEATL
ncbi:APC amino acid permease [Fistulina hepatica ATCC 64428]|uniref:APC amino acid permease n=1 Tax=Fistulina hepatica ATCC 64428 TaxID=1128425 RepID=A0A0D7ABZ1_9AGAR|nr:APC amino acid permease [Fistulina hepatica ATCC 64428]